MLQSMRQLAQSWVFKALMLLLGVSFALWGIGDMFRGNPLHRVVAKAGSASFTVQELNQAFEQALAHARQTLQPDLTAAQAKQLGLADHTLNDMIETSLFEQDLKHLGIDVSDRTVLQLLMAEPALKGKDGKFDKNLLQNFLAERRINERQFLNEQRKDLALRQLVGGMTDLPAPSPFVIDQLYQARAQKRVFDIVTIDSQNLPSGETPNDQTLRDFYQQNPEAFTAPETRSLTIAVLATDSIAKEITISDDQVKKEYAAKQDQLREPEKRDLLQVILPDEAKAKDVAREAKASGNLTAAAKPTGKNLMILNQTEEVGLPPEVAKSVFALPANGVSDPIKTALGWHVIQVHKITASGVPSYDSIKEKLRADMKSDQAADSAANLVNKMDDELAGGHSLDDMAGAMKLRLIKIPAVTAGGQLSDGKEPAELPHKEDLLKAAFGQNSGETSPVMDDKNGNYFVVRTDNITPSALKPLEQVKAQVIAAWKQQQQAKAAAIQAESIAKILGEGKPASNLASKGIETRTSKPVSLVGDSDPSLPKFIMPQIMKLKKGEAVGLPPIQGKYMVVRLAQIMPSTTTKDEAGHGKITSELKNDAQRELAEQYARYLRTLYPVVIKGDALDSIAQQSNE